MTLERGFLEVWKYDFENKKPLLYSKEMVSYFLDSRSYLILYIPDAIPYSQQS